jgi:hypothetical protein
VRDVGRIARFTALAAIAAGVGAGAAALRRTGGRSRAAIPPSAPEPPAPEAPVDPVAALDAARARLRARAEELRSQMGEPPPTPET